MVCLLLMETQGCVKLGALPLVPTCPLGPAALLCAAPPVALPAARDLEISPELGSRGHDGTHSQNCHEGHGDTARSSQHAAWWWAPAQHTPAVSGRVVTGSCSRGTGRSSHVG